MAKHGQVSKISTERRRHKHRELGYYSTPGFITRFITDKMLTINPHGTHWLDPAQAVKNRSLAGNLQARV